VNVYELDPLQDSRWESLVQRHPQSSIFHSSGWLEALRRSYGYEPIVYTTTPPNRDLSNGLVFCYIKSWLTGKRLVSLPFSDHCQPLVSDSEDLQFLLTWLDKSKQQKGWKYVELRPLASDKHAFEIVSGHSSYESYSLHVLDLRPDLGDILRKFHKDCVQRKIRRAKREGLTYEEGRSEDLLSKFYDLLIVTRRRHGVPPQPLLWFRNLIACLAEKITIHLASKDNHPVASIVMC
jgi:hypothetical protein